MSIQFEDLHEIAAMIRNSFRKEVEAKVVEAVRKAFVEYIKRGGSLDRDSAEAYVLSQILVAGLGDVSFEVLKAWRFEFIKANPDSEVHKYL